jgi:hypothetical protein
MKNILVAVDMSDGCTNVFDKGAELARAFSGRLPEKEMRRIDKTATGRFYPNDPSRPVISVQVPSLPS